MEATRDYVLRAVASRKSHVGDAVRLRHEFKKDGTECTPVSKDAAMTVTHIQNGWIYNCHRCGESGFIPNTNISPGMTKERLDMLKKSQVRHKEAVEKVTLPFDFIPMNESRELDAVPWNAYHWIWRYSLGGEDMLRWNIGWSPSYQRVITPIYEYAILNNEQCKKLVGWVGREVKYQRKEEREKAGVAKYLTKKMKGAKRAYFTCPNIVDTGHVILTEDIISAIKVWNSLRGKVETIALLTTTIDNDLILQLRNKKIFLWLDGDMLRKSVKTVSRLRSLGLAAYWIHTPKDPKEYNELYISDMWRSRTLTE